MNELSQIIARLEPGQRSEPMVIERSEDGTLRFLTQTKLGKRVSLRAGLLMLVGYARHQHDLMAFWRLPQALVDEDSTRLTIHAGEDDLALEVRRDDQRITEARQQVKRLDHEIAIAENIIKRIQENASKRKDGHRDLTAEEVEQIGMAERVLAEKKLERELYGDDTEIDMRMLELSLDLREVSIYVQPKGK